MTSSGAFLTFVLGWMGALCIVLWRHVASCVCVAHPQTIYVYVHSRQQAAHDGGGEGAGEAVQVPSHARDRGIFWAIVVWGLVGGGCWAGCVYVIFLKNGNYTYIDHF